MKVMDDLDQQVLKEALTVARDRRDMLDGVLIQKRQDKKYVSPILQKEYDYLTKIVVALDNLDGFHWQHQTHIY